MSLFDLIVPLFFLLFVVYLRFSTRPKSVNSFVGLLVLTLGLLALSILRDVPWLLYPLYLSLPILLFLIYQNIEHQAIKQRTQRAAFWFSLILTLTSISLIVIFPFRSLPEPTGPHKVGTFSWDIHTHREEVYAEQAGVLRSFRVQAWYPASTTEGLEQALWLSDGRTTSSALAVDFGFPGFIFNHLESIPSNGYLNAPIQNGQYPVIIISHGWSGFRHLHTDLAEALASHGFIVIGIEHSYGSVATVLESGDIIPLNPSALPPRSTTPDFLAYANTLVNTYAGDIVSVLDMLEDVSSQPLLMSLIAAMDLDTVVLIGHSTGGGAAVKVGLTDARVHGVIGLDAWVEPLTEASINQGLSLPSLLIRSEAWEVSHNNTTLYQLIEQSSLTPIAYQMNGTTHYDFGMVYMFTRIAPLIGLQGQRGLTMPLTQNALVLDFVRSFNTESDTFSFDVSVYEDFVPIVLP